MTVAILPSTRSDVSERSAHGGLWAATADERHPD